MSLVVQEEATSEELEPEKEEPDRLTELLPHSKFSCQGRGTGYYADEGLACEVFHYCQDGARHSWVCPEGFTFHQVGLIALLTLCVDSRAAIIKGIVVITNNFVCRAFLCVESMPLLPLSDL